VLPLLLILFIAIPIAELWLIIQIGGAIGILPTLGLLIVDSIVGAALARSQSRAAWQRFNLALAEGRAPGKEAFDGAMIILGGALLLTPGFLTDAFGLILLIPPTRALIRGFITRSLARRGAVAFRVGRFGSARSGGGAPPFPNERQGYDYEGSASEVTEPPRELGPDTPEERGRG
ncbi:MAG: FxsA family protein, partial [Actinomycetota bacterium]|nr:FxsA family protein [Actinomycetota bacterium]